MAENHRGNILPIAEAHRIWTERFFPVAPAHTTPNAGRAFVYVSQLPEILADSEMREKTALQAIVARSNEVLLLTFDPQD